MPLRRSRRCEAASLPNSSDSRGTAASSTKRATSTQRHHVRAVPKDGAEMRLTNTADSVTTLSSPTSKKRKLADFQDSKLRGAPNRDRQDPGSAPSIAKTKAQARREGQRDDPAIEAHEKRLRRYRDKPPQAFLEKLHRAQTQRMIVIGRTRTATEAFPSEDIDIVGSTGNIYKVTIGQLPSCTCPDHQKGNECKHKVYALHTVLKAPERLVYQRAFLSSELREIFDRAPPLPTNTCRSRDMDGNRKPIEGECPICYQDYHPEANELVWCKAACGQNVHKSCFTQWTAAQSGAAVRCVFCRTPWETDHGDVQTLTRTGTVNAEGYVNVADQFGMSGVRDYSTYNRFSRHALGLRLGRGLGRWDGEA